jgi:hypothetical protein
MMASPEKKPKLNEYSVVALMFVLILLLSPLREFWAALDGPWYSPYLIWMVAIVVSWLLQRKLNKNDL